MTMRTAFLLPVLALAALAACSRPTTTSTAATTSGAAIVPGHSDLIGAWSFDGSCASEDGMTLAADGHAAVGEREEGTWSVAADGKITINTQDFEPGDLTHQSTGHGQTWTFEMTGPDDLNGMSGDGRLTMAKRCPAAPPAQ